jgi:hypothetical protein
VRARGLDAEFRDFAKAASEHDPVLSSFRRC